MSFKSRFLERENERLRKENQLLLSALLDRAGHHKAAEILRNEEQIKTALIHEAQRKTSTPGQNLSRDKVYQGQPVMRGWRAIKNYWQELSRMEYERESKKSEEENGESTPSGPN